VRARGILREIHEWYQDKGPSARGSDCGNEGDSSDDDDGAGPNLIAVGLDPIHCGPYRVELRGMFFGPVAPPPLTHVRLLHAVLWTPPPLGVTPGPCLGVFVSPVADLDRPVAREAVLLALLSPAFAIRLQSFRGGTNEASIGAPRTDGGLKLRQIEVLERLPPVCHPPIRHFLDDEHVPAQVERTSGSLGHGPAGATRNKEKAQARRHELLQERTRGHVAASRVALALRDVKANGASVRASAHLLEPVAQILREPGRISLS